jgi:hypothetical protein
LRIQVESISIRADLLVIVRRRNDHGRRGRRGRRRRRRRRSNRGISWCGGSGRKRRRLGSRHSRRNGARKTTGNEKGRNEKRHENVSFERFSLSFFNIRHFP